MEKAGVWYLISVFDKLPHDTFALILRVIKVMFLFFQKKINEKVIIV